MKTFILTFLFATTICVAQTDVKSQYKAFEQELETYRNNPEVSSENSLIKPAPCGQYTLKYMVTGKGFDDVVVVPPPRKLCGDLNRFDKSKNPKASADWEYEIKPVGNRYYIIRGDKKGTAGLQEFYYYERMMKK